MFRIAIIVALLTLMATLISKNEVNEKVIKRRNETIKQTQETCGETLHFYRQHYKIQKKLEEDLWLCRKEYSRVVKICRPR